MKPHVVIICASAAGAGAVASVAVRHVRELSRHFRVSLVSDSLPGDAPPDAGYVMVAPRKFGQLRRFAHVPNELAFAFAVRAALVQLHRDHPVGFVICNGHAIASLVAGPLRKSLGIPYALVTHGDIFDRPRGTYDARLTWFYKQVTPPAYRNADLIVALSPHMAELARKGGAKPESVRLIPNGIDVLDIGLDDQMEKTARATEGRLELLYVGRLAVEKGVDLLIEAVSLLTSGRMEARLRIVGAGPESQRLRSLVTQLQLASTIEFLGPLPRVQVGAMYRSADIVCVPSRSDPLPTVVLEAMASSVAVVGSDTGGIPFMIDHGVTGLVCAANSPQALADALVKLGQDTEAIKRMGFAGRQRALEEFNWQKIGDTLASAITAAATQVSRHTR